MSSLKQTFIASSLTAAMVLSAGSAIAGSGRALETFGQGIKPRAATTSTAPCATVKLNKRAKGVQVAIYFHTDKCRANGDHTTTVKAALNDPVLQGKQVFAQVCGNTDTRQTNAYNKRLGQGRANALARLLRAGGASVQTVESGGEEFASAVGNVTRDRDAIGFLYTNPKHISGEGCGTEWNVRHNDYHSKPRPDGLD